MYPPLNVFPLSLTALLLKLFSTIETIQSLDKIHVTIQNALGDHYVRSSLEAPALYHIFSWYQEKEDSYHDKRMNEQAVNKLPCRKINMLLNGTNWMLIKPAFSTPAMICAVFTLWTHFVHDLFTHAFVVHVFVLRSRRRIFYFTRCPGKILLTSPLDKPVLP